MDDPNDETYTQNDYARTQVLDPDTPKSTDSRSQLSQGRPRLSQGMTPTIEGTPRTPFSQPYRSYNPTSQGSLPRGDLGRASRHPQVSGINYYFCFIKII